jgi:hypothetical protein
MIITQFVTIKIGSRNMNHYKSIGYSDVKLNDEITIPIEHLPKGSHEIIDVECDFCKTIVKKQYKSILLERGGSVIKMDCCKNCSAIKVSQGNMLVYGVKNVMQVKEINDRLKQSMLKKYGVTNATMDSEILARAMRANNPEKRAQTLEKTRKTMLEKYGVEYGVQLDYSRKRLFEVRTSESSQQRLVADMVSKIFDSAQRNFSYSNLSLDIFVEIGETKIDVEYDSWYWHERNRDRKRDEFLKGEGFKILRIKSERKIPTEIQLLCAIDILSKTDRKYMEIRLEDWNEEGYLERRAE